VLSSDIIVELPKLRYIGVLATGYDVVDVAAARARGITVTNIPAYGTRSVAQHAMALLLELSNHVGLHARQTSQGRWSEAQDWCYWNRPLTELDELTMGIVGYGAIGRTMAELARAFGMKVLASDQRCFEAQAGVRRVSLDELLTSSDVVSLHCPLTNETRAMINAQSLELMKPTAFLINTSRGPLIDELALDVALRSGKIAGAALDVLPAEPPPRDYPLLSAPNCLITPHQSWASKASRAGLLSTAGDNLRAFLAGSPVNVIS
jgi:glycerate dehydrogenase